MKFLWCTLAVKNMDKSVAFYRDIVGLPVNRRYAAGKGLELCFLGEGETQIELICGRDTVGQCLADGVSLGFEVKSLDDMLDFIKEKELEVASGPVQPNPHIKFFHVKDPDGYSVQFVERM